MSLFSQFGLNMELQIWMLLEKLHLRNSCIVVDV